MKMQVKEFAEFTGVSVRTLHYYDEIGLLVPACVDEGTGYRYYDENSLLRMQEILFYRELDFPLKRIAEILSFPEHDRSRALSEQKNLLILKKERLERLISAVDAAMKGEQIMKAFDNSELEAYKAEAREKWGQTEAYREHEKKTKGYSKDTWDRLAGEMNEILAEFGVFMKHGDEPGAAGVQALVKRLQNHITVGYYHCTDEILAGLGQMYVADERFRENIDTNGDGTAAFICEAIEVYCRK